MSLGRIDTACGSCRLSSSKAEQAMKNEIAKVKLKVECMICTYCTRLDGNAVADLANVTAGFESSGGSYIDFIQICFEVFLFPFFSSFFLRVARFASGERSQSGSSAARTHGFILLKFLNCSSMQRDVSHCMGYPEAHT